MLQITTILICKETLQKFEVENHNQFNLAFKIGQASGKKLGYLNYFFAILWNQLPIDPMVNYFSYI